MKKSLAAIAWLMLSAPAFAGDEPYNFQLELGSWNHGFDGVYSAGPDDVDLKHEDENQGLVSFDITHEIPLIPNIKLRHTELDSDGSGVATSQIQFGDQTFVVGSNLTSAIDIRYTEVTLYYRWIDSFIQVDSGVTTKLVDGEIKLSNGTNTRIERFASPIAMAYSSARYFTPIEGLSVEANGSLLDLGSHNLSDYAVQISWQHQSGYGLNVGYRRINLDLDGLDGISADAKIDGPYLNLTMSM